MVAVRLSHVNMRTSRLEATKDFYVDIIGLKVGHRPDFGNIGYWLYSGDDPVVHLSEVPQADTPRTNRQGDGNGLDHFALDGKDLAGQLDRLKQNDIPYDIRVAASGYIQVFFDDPNGVTVEMGYPVEEEPDAARALIEGRQVFGTVA